MVTSTPSRERAQLMLVGAVTIAVLLVGLVIVFNSALFTETVDQESAVQTGDDAVVFMSQTERDLRSLALRVNHGRQYPDDAAVNSSMEENVTRFDRILSESYAGASATYVNLTYRPEDSVNGRRLVQEDDGDFTRPGAPVATWSPVVAPRTDVGWLLLNLNTSELSVTENFTVRLENDTGEFYEATLTRNDTGYVEVMVNVSANHATNETIRCRPAQGRLLVDVMYGEVHPNGCVPATSGGQFNGTDAYLDPPYRVTFEDGDRAAGRYEIVVREETSANANFDSCPDTDACESAAVWALNASMEFSSSQVRFHKNATVEVYNGTN